MWINCKRSSNLGDHSDTRRVSTRCGWPVDALMGFWVCLGAIATPMKAPAISAEYLAGPGAMLRMG
jgi:hypothetical protein